MRTTISVLLASTCAEALLLSAPLAAGSSTSAPIISARAVYMLAKDSGLKIQMQDSLLNDGAACRFLTDTQREIVSDLLGRDAGEQDTLYECDMPAQDSSLTCFLLPDSWHMNDGQKEGSRPKWLCMENPHPNSSLIPEDSY